MILQKLGKLQLSWNDLVPENIDRKLKILCEEVKLLNNIYIFREVILSNYSRWERHEFCDASGNGCAEVIYDKICNNCNIYVKILTAKTCVAPLKPSRFQD